MFFHVSGGGNEHAQSLVKGQAVSYLPARNRRGPCAIFIKAETDRTSPDDTPLETPMRDRYAPAAPRDAATEQRQ